MSWLVIIQTVIMKNKKAIQAASIKQINLFKPT